MGLTLKGKKMKKLLIIILFILNNYTYSQDDFLCGTEPPIGESILR